MRPTLPPPSRHAIDFNPRIPYGMRPDQLHDKFLSMIFQSTHPVWDATEQVAGACGDLVISIHASRMGCDCRRGWVVCFFRDFNPRIPYGMRRKFRQWSNRPCSISIHASRMGCDIFDLGLHQIFNLFQSTHPVWDATSFLITCDF